MARVEQMTGNTDLDLTLVCRWIAFNALYGQWDHVRKEPKPDSECWRQFLDRLLRLDRGQHLDRMLTEHKQLVLALFDDAYLSRFFWQEPSADRAKKARQPRYEAHTWYLEQRWASVLDRLVERIYLMRCQLVHGAATFGGKLNRDSLRRSSQMLGHLLNAILLTLIHHGSDEDWGTMCYAPLHSPFGNRR
jgi:hypothetical protein